MDRYTSLVPGVFIDDRICFAPLDQSHLCNDLEVRNHYTCGLASTDWADTTTVAETVAFWRSRPIMPTKKERRWALNLLVIKGLYYKRATGIEPATFGLGIWFFLPFFT